MCLRLGHLYKPKNLHIPLHICMLQSKDHIRYMSGIIGLVIHEIFNLKELKATYNTSVGHHNT